MFRILRTGWCFLRSQNLHRGFSNLFGGGSFLETATGANHRKALKVKVASPALPTGLSYSFVNNGPVTSGPDLLNSTTVKITGTAELGQEVLGDTYSVQVEDVTKHKVDSEQLIIPQSCVERVNRAKAARPTPLTVEVFFKRGGPMAELLGL